MTTEYELTEAMASILRGPDGMFAVLAKCDDERCYIQVAQARQYRGKRFEKMVLLLDRPVDGLSPDAQDRTEAFFGPEAMKEENADFIGMKGGEPVKVSEGFIATYQRGIGDDPAEAAAIVAEAMESIFGAGLSDCQLECGV